MIQFEGQHNKSLCNLRRNFKNKRCKISQRQNCDAEYWDLPMRSNKLE